MNDQCVSSSQKEIIETIVFEPFQCEWNQETNNQVQGLPLIPKPIVRLVSFDDPQELSDKLQEVMMSSLHNDNDDNQFLAGTTEKSLSPHPSLPWVPTSPRGPSVGPLDDYNNDQSHDGSMDEEEMDWSDFDESYFTSGSTSCQIPVIPEPPIQEFSEHEERMKRTHHQPKAKPLRRKGIKLDDVLRTRVWGKCVKISSKQRRPTVLRRQASE